MAHKINIRSFDNTSWINLLEAVHHSVADVNGKFTGITVESVLEELFDRKTTRVVDTSDPDQYDDIYQVGTIWINTIADTVYVCVDNTTGLALWLNVSSIDFEGTQDTVGFMFTGNVDYNIASTYNDVTGKIDLTVPDTPIATNTVLGIASFNTFEFYVNAGAVSLNSGSISATHLTNDIDMSARGFNADMVDGKDVDDLSTSESVLWTATKITSFVDSIAKGLSWQEPVITMALNDPPITPSTGDRYVVSASSTPATGDWTGFDNNIAEWDGFQWVMTYVLDGFALWDKSLDAQVVYNADTLTWTTIGATITHANLKGLQGGISGELYHITSTEYDSFAGVKPQNTVFAAPSILSGFGGFRLLVSDDIPSLLSSKITGFTEDVQDISADMIVGGTHTNITPTYNDTTGFLSFVTPTAGVIDGTPGVASFDDTHFNVATSGHVTLDVSAVDHGTLNGLGDDDHTQYVHITDARTITAQHTFAPTTTIAPFLLNSNAQGELVVGFNADLLNGQDWTVAATASEPTSPAVNDIWIEVI